MAETTKENGVGGPDVPDESDGAGAGTSTTPGTPLGPLESSGERVDPESVMARSVDSESVDLPAAVEPMDSDDGPTVPLPADTETVPFPTGDDTVPLPTGDETVPLSTDQERPVDPEKVADRDAGSASWVRRGLPRLTSANAMIAVLLALLGFTMVVQLKTNSTDASLETTRQEDLVRILSDLDAQEERVRQDIAGLEASQRQLNSGAQGRQAALDEATRRADELGILAGTLPARGPGLMVSFVPVSKRIAASRVLDAVQELRGAGAEAMQIAGGDGAMVRIIASTYFLDADGGISVSGRRLTGPYMITVIGDPKTMETALNIPGGVVASVSGDGGNVAIQEREVVDVTALSPPKDLQHARPVS